MKKNVIFIINNLNCGGAEKGLISLLETLDYSRYDVDLFLFKHEGLFYKKVPSQVNILDEPLEFRYYDMPIKQAIFKALKEKRFDITLSRIQAGIIFKTERNLARCEQRVWKYLSKVVNAPSKNYDVSIGFLEKNPIYFSVDNVKAKKKIGFIHTDYEKLQMDPKIDAKYFEKLSHIVTVSNESSNVLKNIFPENSDKITVIKNIVSANTIRKMSLDNIYCEKKDITIVSVGRLHSAKGFDLAIEACDLLLKKGYKVLWYVVGEGPERNKLESIINEKKINNNFKLVGMQENPYPYIKMCDIYVQTSLFEGSCISITEAKILRKPIVSTNFRSISDQIIDGVNGLIVDMKAEEIMKGIVSLIEDQRMRNKIVSNLSDESLGNEEEVNKLYDIIDVT
ncbi:glycosyltransferase involved in cell wall biosynthesis [Evansella vedderi]|uniref:Glycosyltransferase involved in cell wall biosynthesis n=1 Tax=Evansella vedderi TaxID=38282 RepID=A0ABU0A041_9BACI|nr:glycosyltransferase [Evansella vedderi]MDQ0256580.1 glycosyltransferase involved in cell wall biosynthesis [Evansella vedderi]